MMNKGYGKIVHEARQYVMELLSERLDPGFHYHNPQHTLDVLKYAETIGRFENLGEKDLDLLRVSALFHDVGYVDCYAGHEEVGVNYAQEFMQKKGAGESEIKQVTQAIMATKVPQKPKDDISRMLCDADLFYLSDDSDYFSQAEKLRKEWRDMGISDLTTKEFQENSLDFFMDHHYHTRYGKLFLLPGKEKVAALIRKKLSDKPSDSSK
ncbi:MAG: HD domain-containing protein [bacterium]